MDSIHLLRYDKIYGLELADFVITINHNDKTITMSVSTHNMFWFIQEYLEKSEDFVLIKYDKETVSDLRLYSWLFEYAPKN